MKTFSILTLDVSNIYFSTGKNFDFQSLQNNTVKREARNNMKEDSTLYSSAAERQFSMVFAAPSYDQKGDERKSLSPGKIK